ncbi:OPT oligopeptide transporter protein-domain-containing protein [Dendryphion nanum]|uniref:OPT oligopeptide transporter protein-domain-containing protein n=1 Tax=Dendryphion nanum TaxID=256645 RepID=A0A9P9EJ76_9PLEO|nr:OPT oligopeptide transporter protein-domain-containing protein [Dendryphion nanum]
MVSEARCSRDRSESAASSLTASLGGFEGADFDTVPGNYELHVLPEKARSVAALHQPNPPPDDAEAGESSTANLPPDKKKNMSRAPLLVRSSPAQGTGSYGGLPVLSLSSSPADSDLDDHHVTHRSQARSKRKGKSKLRHSEPASNSGASINRTHDDLVRSEPIATSSRTRRRSTRDESSTGLLHDAFEGSEESGLEPRFNASSAGPATESAPRRFQDPYASSSSSHITVDGTDGEEEESSDSDELHDLKSNGRPSDDSPYAQVRASVAPTDDLSLSINTPRMWTLAMIFSILGSSTNLFFSLRFPSVTITPIIALLLVHPLGLLWDQTLKRSSDPDETFLNGSIQLQDRLSRGAARPEDSPPSSAHGSHRSLRHNSRRHRFRLWLGQGRWNQKEHCCVYIASNVSFGFAFATDVIVEQTKFYHQDLGIVYQVLLTLSTQILGYALAGLSRQYLVRPSGMIWPSTLVSTAMFTALHKDENKPADGWRVSRSRFFLYVFGGSVAFYFLPGLLMPALSTFNVITWFAPKNVVIANLFGVSSGLGMFPMTFDWSQIAFIGSPLVTPFWAALNIVGGLVVVMWIAAPIMYYANIMYSSYMPILSSAVFDNRGKPYEVSKILTDDFLFDQEAYENYSRVFLPITYVLSYALQFAALTALLSHTALWHGKDIVRQWQRSWAEIRRSTHAEYEPLPANTGSNGAPSSPRVARTSTTLSEPGLEDLLNAEDVHNRLMRRYDDVPITWYLLTGVSMAAIGMFVVEYYPIHLPWYGLLLALSIGAILFVPIGIVMAITNQQSSLYLICQLICGAAFPGRPVANMVFTTYGYITSTQGLKFSSDLKLGHYMKIPPKILFNLQVTATIISSLTQIGVLNWMLKYIPGICTPYAINGFTCPIARVHFNGSILWGVVGPKRFFGAGALYRPLVWAFLVGAIAPIGIWIFARNNRKSILRKVNLAVVFGSLSWIPPATGLNFSVWAIVCYVFNYEIKKRKSAWWRKYNMTLSAALDSGLAVGVVIVFFGIVFPGWMSGFSWWGTEVYKQGCDWIACAYKTVPKGEHFGPKVW